MCICRYFEQGKVSHGDGFLQTGYRVHGPEILSSTRLQHQRGIKTKDGVPPKHYGEAAERCRGLSEVFQLLLGKENKA